MAYDSDIIIAKITKVSFEDCLVSFSEKIHTYKLRKDKEVQYVANP